MSKKVIHCFQNRKKNWFFLILIHLSSNQGDKASDPPGYVLVTITLLPDNVMYYVTINGYSQIMLRNNQRLLPDATSQPTVTTWCYVTINGYYLMLRHNQRFLPDNITSQSTVTTWCYVTTNGFSQIILRHNQRLLPDIASQSTVTTW